MTLPESTFIEYSEGCKYYTRSRTIFYTGILGYEAKTKYITLTKDGVLVLDEGFPWDGPSGPTIDTPSSMRCSAGHDALYELCRLSYLPRDLQPKFDELLEKWALEDGMWKVRAKWWEKLLNKFGRVNLYPSHQRSILRAP